MPFSAETMFDLVADIESYPLFLPGCLGARIRTREGDVVVGTVSLAQPPLRMEFTTRNELLRPQRITMTLEEGPFRELQGAWEFLPLAADGCRVSLKLKFAFESRMAETLLGPAFEALCNRLVDAFVRRARERHA